MVVIDKGVLFISFNKYYSFTFLPNARMMEEVSVNCVMDDQT